MRVLADPDPHTLPVPPTGMRVLVVDNDPDAVDLVVTDLTLEGHQVVGTAYDGVSAIAMCQALMPDVMVVDVRMPPGPTGVDVVTAVRGQRGLRCIVYTNYRDTLLRRTVARLGAVFLVKGELVALREAVLGPPVAG
ncbi:MAG TPA: response regulator [Mycobacteriales bacterium]|nr:response regulator [Mycobacteriales bacterium]